MGKNIKYVDESIKQKIIQDYQNCKSIRQIEQDYGVTRYSVTKYLEEQILKQPKVIIIENIFINSIISK